MVVSWWVVGFLASESHTCCLHGIGFLAVRVLLVGSSFLSDATVYSVKLLWQVYR